MEFDVRGDGSARVPAFRHEAFYNAHLDPEAWAVADFKVDRQGQSARPPREPLVDTERLILVTSSAREAGRMELGGLCATFASPRGHPLAGLPATHPRFGV